MASSVTKPIVRLANASVYLDSVPASTSKNHTAIASNGCSLQYLDTNNTNVNAFNKITSVYQIDTRPKAD